MENLLTLIIAVQVLLAAGVAILVIRLNILAKSMYEYFHINNAVVAEIVKKTHK